MRRSRLQPPDGSRAELFAEGVTFLLAAKLTPPQTTSTKLPARRLSSGSEEGPSLAPAFCARSLRRGTLGPARAAFSLSPRRTPEELLGAAPTSPISVYKDQVPLKGPRNCPLAKGASQTPASLSLKGVFSASKKTN